ncbi:hypothetical protein GCM10011611_39270 [Aliidongia dinghuensis]|uniref:Uncharacterized protein n=1 Tax=Aliidongia dinghuensis TaxID=1867774 RepID=A0A8J2YWP3_9PROT|nr:hypothetical protein [Aliidongia dinghuensis]GGF29369.1 hypothetical protein GCM10011611_39270 [Aliidongia dinghuensis]
MIIAMPPRNILAKLRAYAAHDDPLVATTNLVALVVAGNIPFYPVYYLALIGWSAWPSLLDLPAALAFFAIPWIVRHSSLLGRTALPVIGVANALICVKLLGEASGNALYLVPCVVAAALSFRANERWVMLPLVWLPVAMFLATLGRLGEPLVPFTEAEFTAMLRLNAVSAGVFVGFLGMLYGRSAIVSARASR